MNPSGGKRNALRSILKVDKKPHSFYYNWKIIHMMVFIIWVPFQVKLKWVICSFGLHLIPEKKFWHFVKQIFVLL